MNSNKPVREPRHQIDIVNTTLGARAASRMTATVERIPLPGLENMDRDDLGAALANLLKSRAGITSITYNVGSKYVEVTSESDLSVD